MSGSTVSRIRGFLLQLPKPSSLRVTGDGDPQTLKPGRSYAKAAETIAALGVDLVEALDADGNILRALRLQTEETRRSDAAAIPEGLKSDPVSLQITHFANLIHRAYEHSTEVAFTRLVELVERMGDRADAIEARLERAEAANRSLLQRQVDDAFDRAEEVAERAAEQQTEAAGGLEQQMIGAFLSGKMQAQPTPKAPPKATNGKGS